MDVTTIFPIRTYSEERGCLSVIEEVKDIPMEFKRVFWMTKCPKTRGGEHTNDCNYFMVALRGSARVLVGSLPTYGGVGGGAWSPAADPVLLDSPEYGVFVKSGYAIKVMDFSDDAIVVVFADGPYRG